MTSAAAILRSPIELTKEWLASVLDRPVLTLEAHPPATSNWGSHVRLSAVVHNEPHPLRLHLKIASAATFGTSEVDYYTKHFKGLANAPLAHCHYAAADATHYNLLLDDLSETHTDQKEIEPTGPYGMALVDAAATLHAHHWPQPVPTTAVLETAAAKALTCQHALLEAMKSGFSARERETAAAIFDHITPARKARTAHSDGFTWIHGDLNPTNILAPRNGSGPLYLIDHQPFLTSPVHSWLGASDIAYAIVPWWPTEIRRQHERALVQHWHNALVAKGVRNYTPAQAWDDWRLCGLCCIDIPADWCSSPEDAVNMRWLWETQLKRVLAFADDHL